MDLWLVAAVAGAGCLAKYFSRFSKNDDSSSHLSSEDSSFKHIESPSHSLCKQALKDSLDSGEVRCFRNCNDFDVLSVSDFNYVEDGNQQGSNIGGNCGFLLSDLSAEELGYVHNHSGNETFIRARNLYGHISRPSNSLESCVMAQLCEENAKMKEHVMPLSLTKRSFCVFEGSHITSRTNAGDDSFSVLTGTEGFKLHKEAGHVKGENKLFRSFDNAKKMKFSAGNVRCERLNSSNIAISGKNIRTQHDTTFLFSLGISFGITTSILATRREMGKLRELLKQTENLVQDLHEELQMKDSMTVKELHSENYGSQDTCDHSFCDKELARFSPEKHMDNSPIIDCEKSYDQREEESSESMSKIEAELEAELERLGLNMNESSSGRTLLELVELDPDFIADFAQDELQTDMINGKDFFHPKLNEDGSDPMIFPGSHAVSPHELCLRLHEVMQTRLEERVHELEVALENSQRKLQFMESEREGHSLKSFTIHGHDTMAEPLVTNLSGESLGAYNGTYEELTKIDNSQDSSPSGIHNTEHKVSSRSHDWHLLGVQHCGSNDPLICSTFNEERLSRELSSGEVTMLEGQSSSIYELNDVTGDEKDQESDCEVERQLIKEIVERTKKGSTVFQNAQRMLCSTGEDEH